MLRLLCVYHVGKGACRYLLQRKCKLLKFEFASFTVTLALIFAPLGACQSFTSKDTPFLANFPSAHLKSRTYATSKTLCTVIIKSSLADVCACHAARFSASFVKSVEGRGVIEKEREHERKKKQKSH